MEDATTAGDDLAKKNPPSPKAPFLFCVVTAAYNASPWLDTLLGALTKQTLDFTAHIQVVLVDDGSTDRTPDIAKGWVERFPGNIVLIRQENAGPAAARNRGLAEARGEWVSFIDSDDFVSLDYFEIIRNFLETSGFDGPVAACNTLFYLETENCAADWHPLGYKFKETRVADLLREPDLIQLFVNACVVRRDLLARTGLRFDPRVKPSFEDAHFLNLVLLGARDFRMAFIKEAHYFYRKRGLGAGLVEGGWFKAEKYRDQLLFGYLDLLRQYKRVLGHVPDFIQNLVLYEAHWYLIRLLDDAPPRAFTDEEANAFFELEALVFQHVDVKRIILSTLPSLELRSRVAMLAAFKGVAFNGMPFMVAELSPGGREAHLIHWSTAPVASVLRGPDGEAPMPWEKRIVHAFGGRVLCHEYRCWAPLEGGAARWPEADGRRVGILCRGEMLETLDPDIIRRLFYLPPEAMKDKQRALFAAGETPGADALKNCWILMDRVHKADDSAEHLCRWLMREHPETKAVFVLDRKSKDWDRLAREGFPLVAYLRKKHLAALAGAAWLISTHVDDPVIDPFHTRVLFGKPAYKVAFLQHGIIKEDLSRWLNQISLDVMVTSARREYESLLSGRYKFTKREIVLTGLPRLDALLAKAKTMRKGRTILFCPTWRQHLRRTPVHVPGMQAGEARLFGQSHFFKAWSALAGSPALAKLSRETGYKMLFLPHPEVVRFLPLFPRSEAFTYLDWNTLKSVQDLLASCAMAVTDYSSLVFDAAYIGRPIAYYHFPEVPDMYASNERRLGYFDYARDGLGPVFREQAGLEAWIEEMIGLDCARQEPYESRALSFYGRPDGQNCRRVHEALLERS